MLNDENYGNYGYWAIGNYTKHISVTQMGNSTANHSYLAVVTFNGTWRTIKGLKSPNAGTTEQSNGTGTFTSTYTAMLSGKLNTSYMLSGFIGVFNLNGSVANLLNQTGPRDPFNWTTIYFGTNNDYMNILSENSVFIYKNESYIEAFNYSKNGSILSYGDIVT